MYEQTQRYDHCEDLVDYEILLCLLRASILTVFVADVRYTSRPTPARHQNTRTLISWLTACTIISHSGLDYVEIVELLTVVHRIETGVLTVERHFFFTFYMRTIKLFTKIRKLFFPFYSNREIKICASIRRWCVRCEKLLVQLTVNYWQTLVPRPSIQNFSCLPDIQQRIN